MCAMPESSPADMLSAFQEIACRSLSRYDFSSKAKIAELSYSENITYLVEDIEIGRRAVLRVSRPGYHTRAELDAEALWVQSIRQDSVITVPLPIKGRNGDIVQEISSEDGQVFYCMMFEYLTGTMPDEEGSGLPYQFEKLGEITARLHEHVRNWEQSQSLKRFRWDYDAMLGKNPEWGRQDGLGVTGKRKELFQKVAGIIKERLDRFGQSPDRFGLIHADLRLTNLLVEKNELKVIDFDDCGYSWFLYDLAASLTFIEHKDYAQTLIQAWLRGYRKARALSKSEEEEIPTFIMLRRLLMVAWVKSHEDNETAQSQGVTYTLETEKLAEKYLRNFG